MTTDFSDCSDFDRGRICSRLTPNLRLAALVIEAEEVGEDALVDFGAAGFLGVVVGEGLAGAGV